MKKSKMEVLGEEKMHERNDEKKKKNTHTILHEI